MSQVVSPSKTKHKAKGGHQKRTTWLVMAWHGGHQRQSHGPKTLYGHWLSPRVRPSTKPKTSTTRHELACVGLARKSSSSWLLRFLSQHNLRQQVRRARPQRRAKARTSKRTQMQSLFVLPCCGFHYPYLSCHHRCLEDVTVVDEMIFGRTRTRQRAKTRTSIRKSSAVPLCLTSPVF